MPGERAAAEEMENVMHAGGYLDRSVTKTSPTRLGIVVTVHVAALAALMLAPAEIIKKPAWFPNPEIYNVPEKKAPEPVVEKQDVPEGRKPVPTPDIIRTEPPIVPTIDPGPLPTLGGEMTRSDGGGTTIVPMEPVFAPARIARNAPLQPDYPTSLARQGIEGVTTVRVLIGTDGRVKQVELVSTTEPDFFTATKRQALRYWRFTPATRDGVAVESWREMTVRFKLEA